MAARIEPGFEMLGADRMIIIVLDLVGTAPGHLDRRAELPRQHCRLGDIIGFRLSAKTAAQQGDMQRHLRLVQPEHLGDKCLRRLRVLGRRPDLAMIGGRMGDRGRHFHRGMREMRHEIIGRDPARRRA